MSAPKLPDGLPPLPAGAVYLGKTGYFITGAEYFRGWRLGIEGWDFDDEWAGDYPNSHYAAPIDSEIARLNGHVSKPAADSEAVALVRKLRDALDARHNQRDYAFLDHASLLKEAEAFLAREGK